MYARAPCANSPIHSGDKTHFPKAISAISKSNLKEFPMIQAVTTPAHKQAFATAIQGAPYFRAVMGRDLALWADNPGAPCGSSPCPVRP